MSKLSLMVGGQESLLLSILLLSKQHLMGRRFEKLGHVRSFAVFFKSPNILQFCLFACLKV